MYVAICELYSRDIVLKKERLTSHGSSFDSNKNILTSGASQIFNTQQIGDILHQNKKHVCSNGCFLYLIN